ncbi:polysaccharide lyase [Botryobacter ruber]|uniref:polysaccharide lyase n=1 Tax=Botryobacter ruber TaxID=2171629 RepID=UPI0013E3B1E3|nr:polysaccharide lyase [Botryobacter ruber]
MNFNFRNVVVPVLLGLAVVACDKKDMEEIAPEAAISAQSTSLATSAQLIFEETAEGSTFFPLSGATLNKTHGIENCGLDWTLASVTSPAREHEKAIRFEIRKGQPLVGSSGKIRSEVTVIKGSSDDRFSKDIWYSFSVYFPSVGFEYDDERDCLIQWYEDGSDETTIRAENNKVYLEVTPANDSTEQKTYDLFSSNTALNSKSKSLAAFSDIPKDQWNEFVFHFVHSTGSDGLIEVWRNGVKIHHITGRNMHLKYPKWKMGLYKSSFLAGSSPLSSRVIYFDNIRVGKPTATLADMSSGIATGTTTVTLADTTATTATEPERVTSTDTTSTTSF